MELIQSLSSSKEIFGHGLQRQKDKKARTSEDKQCSVSLRNENCKVQLEEIHRYLQDENGDYTMFPYDQPEDLER